MKKILFRMFAACPAICLAAACAKETTPSADSLSEPMVVRASVTKTVLDGEAVNWCVGDAISVFSATGAVPSNNRFESDLTETSAVAAFSGEIEKGTTEFYALYPYDGEAALEEGVITTVIPAVQNAVDGSFDNGASVTLAKGVRTPGQTDAPALMFKNMCAVLSFKLPENITFADRITVASKSGANMAGKIAIDCVETPAIISASEPSVIVNGTFAGGCTYYVTVAPGTYSDGFTFTVETAGGNRYVRENPSDITAVAGKIYPLGSLSLVMTETEPSAAATITHTNDGNGDLNGSVARISFSGIPAEFTGAVSFSASLKNASGTVCRTYQGPAGTDIVMDVANGYTYLPQGTYTLEAVYNNGSFKSYALSCTNPVSPAPSFQVSVSGATSYSYALGKNGVSKNVSTANSKDPYTAYALSTRVAISPALMQDSKISKSYTCSFNGETPITIQNASNLTLGDRSGLALGAYKWSATCLFDGVSVSSDDVLHITGLPYAYVFSSSSKDADLNEIKGEGWNTNGKCGVMTDQFYYTNSGTKGWITRKFHIPSDLSVNFTVVHKFYESTISTNNMDVYIDGVSSASGTTTANTFKVAGSNNTSGYKGEVTSSGYFSMSAANCYVCLANDGTHKGIASYFYIHNIALSYR